MSFVPHEEHKHTSEFLDLLTNSVTKSCERQVQNVEESKYWSHRSFSLATYLRFLRSIFLVCIPTRILACLSNFVASSSSGITVNAQCEQRADSKEHFQLEHRRRLCVTGVSASLQATSHSAQTVAAAEGRKAQGWSFRFLCASSIVSRVYSSGGIAFNIGSCLVRVLAGVSIVLSVLL
jgi:hypothetical protein